MPIRTLDYTGSTGPGVELTNSIFENVSSLSFDLAAQIITVVYNNGQIRHLTLNGATTISCTTDGIDYAFTVA